MFFRFLRKSKTEPLPLTMAAVRMGERLLQIGVDDPGLTGALALKVGLSGSATLVVASEQEAARGRSAGAKAGALLNVQVVTPLRNLPFEDESFDLIIIHSMNGLIAMMAPYTRVRCLEESLRILRIGGRALIIEPEPRGGLGALIRSHPVDAYYTSGGGAMGALKMEGFRPVRILADREGYRFTEGLKTKPPTEDNKHGDIKKP